MRRRLLIEALDPRQVFASVAGAVFDDAVPTWRQETSESGLEQRLLFVDANDNSLPDDGEKYALSNADGTFALDDLGADAQIVRLFQSAPSQTLDFPIIPEPSAALISLATADPASVSRGLLVQGAGDRLGLTLTDAGVVTLDLSGNSALEVTLGGRPTAAQSLPDGRWLVLASDALGNHAFLVTPGGESQPLAFLSRSSGGGMGPLSIDAGGAGWSDVAVGPGGLGLLLPRSTGTDPVSLYRVQLGETPTADKTPISVDPRTDLVAGQSLLSIIAQPTNGGLAFSQWSNSTGTVISGAPITIAGASRVLGYAEESGLLYVLMGPQAEQAGQSVMIIDVDGGFVPLRTLTGLGAVQAVDIARSVIFTLDTAAGSLRAIDALEGVTIGDWKLTAPQGVDLGFLGGVTEMAVGPAGDELTLLAPGIVASVAISKPDAHRVNLASSGSTYPLRFAARVQGTNAPPSYTEPLEFFTLAGKGVSLLPGALLAGAKDTEADPMVVVRKSATTFGSVQITPQGAMTYVPNPGFVGTDSFEVFLHDGRGASQPQTVTIRVLADEANQPTLEFDLSSLPQDVKPGFVAGRIRTVGLVGPVSFVIGDPRFQVIGNQILVVEGAQFSPAGEPVIRTEVRAYDSASQQTLTSNITIEFSSERSEISDIQPRSAAVIEQQEGMVVADLQVIAPGPNVDVSISVDDPRFVVVFRTLRLRAGVKLDHATEPTVDLRITATESREGGQSLSVPFRINVVQTPEPPTTITLGGDSVTEYIRGDQVGPVIVNGTPIDTAVYSATVNDSRFEISRGILKLRDGVYLSRIEQEEASMTVTVRDLFGLHEPVSQEFVINVLANANPFHNPSSPLDVNSDSLINPLDALLILNAISTAGGASSISSFPPEGEYWDVNGDGFITPLDSLLILNHINRGGSSSGVTSPEDPNGNKRGEGESADGDSSEGGSSDGAGVESPADPLGSSIPGPEDDELRRRGSGF